MRILLATDGSEASDTAVAEVAARPWPPASTVRVLCVAASILPGLPLAWYAPGVDANELESREQARARDAVDRAAERLRASGLVLETKVLTGQARAAIVDEAEAWPADLIVVGAHGYTGLRRLLLGSVASFVVAHAPCSVEIVRERRA
jgi:nucleotide-binding universal stress UspA family protein